MDLRVAEYQPVALLSHRGVDSLVLAEGRAGPSLEHALSHALLELIQRDGNAVDYRALDRGVAVDAETSDPETRDLLAHLDREGVDGPPRAVYS